MSCQKGQFCKILQGTIKSHAKTAGTFLDQNDQYHFKLIGYKTVLHQYRCDDIGRHMTL